MGDAPMPALWGADAARHSVPVSRNGYGRCRMHGGASTGAPKENKNAIKHGRYTAENIAFRRGIALLAREARKTTAAVF